MGKKKSGKKGSKKGSKKKKGSGKKDGGESGPINHGGFTPEGQAIKVWCTDVLTAVEDTPERATARAIAPFVKTSLGDVPVEAVAGDANGLEPNGTRGLPRAAFVRVGELHYNTVRDLKQRIHEVTGWPVQKMALFFAAPPESGGRPVKELFGWAPEWPWNPNTCVVHLDDDLTLASYGILKRSQRRIDADNAAREEHLARLENDEEYRRQHEKAKLMAEVAKQDAAAGKKKSGKGKKSGKKGSKKGSGKGAAKGKDGKKMTEKELAAHEAKEKAKAEKRKAEMIAEQDEMRKWPENQVYLVLKAHGVPERTRTSAFVPRPGQPILPRLEASFSPLILPKPAFQNSVAISPPPPDEDAPPQVLPMSDILGDLTERFSALPPPSGWPDPPPPPDPNAPPRPLAAKPKKGSKKGSKKKGSKKKKR